MSISERYKEAASQIGNLFCWCIEHLKRFPPAEGDWLDDVKRRLLAAESTPPIVGIIGRLIAADYEFLVHDGKWALWYPHGQPVGELVMSGETFEQLCVNILMAEIDEEGSG